MRYPPSASAAVLIFLAACGSPTPPDAGLEDAATHDAGVADAGADAGPELHPYEAWRLLQSALRTSPDHRIARAERLVAAKDLEGLFLLVRDDIALSPLPTGAVINPATAMRFGPRATLRGGTGTFRDRAELLVTLLERAGFPAEVVYGTPSGALDASAMRKAWLRAPQAGFDPGAPPTGHTSWQELISGATASTEPPGLDPDGAEARALAGALLIALDGGFAAPAVSLDLPTVVPYVRATLDGGALYLNPIRADARVGDRDADLTGEAPAAEGPPDVEAVVELVRSDEPTRRIEVLRGRYPLDDVLGRQLVVRFAPPEPFELFFGRSNESLRTFVPVLALGGSDLTAEESAARATVGTAFTRGGDLLATDAQSTLSVNGLPFATGDASRAADVRQVQVTVKSASRFPEVELEIAALDANGQPVGELPASVFEVSESGSARPAMFRANTSAAPRVLVLLDLSLSQPLALTDTTARRQLGQTLGAAVLAAAPNARVQVAALGGLPVRASGFEALDAATIGERFETVSGSGSPIYGALSEAAESGANLIVLLTDGLANETADDIARREPALARAAPILAVGCATSPSTIDQLLLARLAAMAGGRAVNAQDLSSTATITAALGELLAGQKLAPYRANYLAPTGATGLRTVQVRVGSTSGSGSYVAPATSTPPSRIAGVRLTLSFRGETVSRWLAGGAATRESELAVDGLLLGNALVSFEAGAPSLSILLDEIVTSRLATRALYDAALARDGDAVLAAWRQAWPAVPWFLAAMHPPLLARPGTAVRESRFRAVLVTTSLGGGSLQRVDLLPFTRFETLGASTEADAFPHTLEASLRLARVEALLHPNSTQSKLSGKALRHYPPGGLVDGDLPQGVPAGERAHFLALLSEWSGHHRLVAADGSTLAFWAVHPSGSATGVLPDGSGGSQSKTCAPIDWQDAYFDTLTLLYRILGWEEVSVYQVLGKFAAVTAVKAALCLTGGPVPKWVTNGNAFVELTCDLARALAGDLFGVIIPKTGNRVGDIIGAYANDALGKDAIRCPPAVPPGACP